MPRKIAEGRTDAFLRAVGKLRDTVAACSEPYLPRVCELAKESKVATATMLDAVRALCREGVLTSRSGMRTRINKNYKLRQECGNAGDSAAALYEKLRAEILNGTIRTKERLPKINFFVIAHHISGNTVCEAFRLLARNNLIHHEGKKWVAGAAPRPPSSTDLSIAGERRTILLIFSSYHEWEPNAFRASGFYFKQTQAAIAEIEKHGLSLTLAYIAKEGDETGVCCGKDEIFALIEKLGERYCGSIIEAGPEHEQWVHRLIAFKKPVITFNYHFQTIASGNLRDHYAYCTYDSENGIRLALDTLVNSGHRYIALPFPFFESRNTDSWAADRAGLIQEYALKFHPQISILPVPQKEEYWFHEIWREREEAFPSFLDSLAVKRESGPAKKDVMLHRKALRSRIPSLAAILDNPGVTAIIAPNDRIARMYRAWFSRMGAAFPRNYSIIGFDNDFRSRFFPISTIDFGLEDAGYLGAHFLLGDIPVKIDRNRNIFGAVRFINRGSIINRLSRKQFEWASGFARPINRISDRKT